MGFVTRDGRARGWRGGNAQVEGRACQFRRQVGFGDEKTEHRQGVRLVACKGVIVIVDSEGEYLVGLF